MSLDLEALLQPVSPEAPCGEDLEFDAAFGEMERAAEGKPEQQYGETLIPAEEPDWKTVRRCALDLAGRTKDLRVGVHLARALLQLDGLPGLRDALALLRGYVEQYWETVHPRLDPDDNNDPTLRVNTINGLVDYAYIVRYIHTAPLVKSRAITVSYRDIEVAKGDLPPAAGEEPPQLAAIQTALMECDLAILQSQAELVSQVRGHLEGLVEAFANQVGIAQSPDMDKLVELCRGIERELGEFLNRRGASLGGGGEDKNDEAANGSDGASAESPAAAPAAAVSDAALVNGAIRSRQDVIRVLDRLCEYYQEHEPSSPVPLLLRRAKRLASMTFLEIVRELTPEAYTQAQAVGGLSPDLDRGVDDI